MVDMLETGLVINCNSIIMAVNTSVVVICICRFCLSEFCLNDMKVLCKICLLA